MNTKNLKPFNLEAALAGEPVMLRNGDKAYVRHHETALPVDSNCKIWGVHVYEDGSVNFLAWSHGGGYFEEGGTCERDIIGMYPKTRMISGFEVPAPETQKPKSGTTYFIPGITTKNLFASYGWIDDSVYYRMLNRGLVFLSKEDAIANAKAMLGIDPYGAAEE